MVLRNMTNARFNWRPKMLWLLLLLPLTACQSSRVQTPVTPPQPYMRVVRSNDGAAALGIVIREFHSPKKHRPVIYLAGVSHIGDAAYYEAMQNRLESAGLVLFEGVRASEERAKPRPNDASAPPPRKMPARPTGEFSLQADLAKSLGLSFQLDAIDYERPHFLNSDMTITQISEVLNPGRQLAPPGTGTPANTGEDSGAAQFENLMSAMDGSGFMGGVIQMGVKFIGSSTKLQTLVKLSFIEMLGSLEGDLSRMEMPSPGLKELLKVLIDKRNHIVMEDLRATLAEKQPPKSIAIFYGAAHMPDLEMRLQQELGYRPVKDDWLTAFSVDPQKTGVTAAEVQLIKGIVDWQMKMLKPPAKPATEAEQP